MEQDENEGLERLAAAALARAAETIADIFETTEEDGPAKLLLSALTLVVKFSLREHDRVVTIGRDHRPPDNISDSTSLYVTKPTTTDGLPKLAVWAYDHTGRLLGHAGWRRAVVEIYPGPPEVVTGIFGGRGRNMKEVHEIRFTLAELRNDPWATASKILDWASWSFG
ncbi:hypothetical protein [Bradyrhizobium australafricanum]|uniref:hypothetical protein n=1 Tax=Bradyrhizobium australafricanum TaxID=2821406 RepID=UPI001CE3512B|nr:hypothetical protein [Bradyrhizobium australafricanum]MCA6104969.1 hypothetical protein [Bradyrhizobium australafricanum]